VFSGMLRSVALVRSHVSEDLSASIRVTRISEIGTTVTVIPGGTWYFGISSQRASVGSYS
jgi:hypothetical protein